MSFFIEHFAFLVQSAFFILMLIIVKYYFDNRRLFVLGSKLPKPRSWPIIGNSLEYVGKDIDTLYTMTEHSKEHGLGANWIGHKLYVYISDPEYAEMYYSCPYLIDRPKNFEYIEAALGKGIITANGMQWKKAKKFMEPAFRASLLQCFDLYQEKTNELLQSLQKEEGKQSFSIYSYITNCTFEIVYGAIMPSGLDGTQKRKELLNHAHVIMDYICERILHPWKQPNLFCNLSKRGNDHFQRINIVKDYIDSEVNEAKILFNKKKENLKENDGETSEKRILLEKLIESKQWNDDELRDHIITNLIAGYDTSALAICFTLIMLGIHKDVQEKLYNEISNAFDEGLNEKDLHQLEYLEMVIKESLRLYPIVPFAFRRSDADIQMGKYLIPKGAEVGINLFGLHRNPKMYENPDAFNPDNFLPENIKKRHPYSFVPFGMGLRKCIGSKFAMTSLRMIVSKILRKYKIECDLKMEEVRVEIRLNLQMRNGIYPLRLIKR